MSEEEKTELMEFCHNAKDYFQAMQRPFVLAVGGISGKNGTTQAIMVSGSTTQVEYLVIEILRVVTEAQKKEEEKSYE